eukprot:gene18026-biopygen4734
MGGGCGRRLWEEAMGGGCGRRLCYDTWEGAEVHSTARHVMVHHGTSRRIRMLGIFLCLLPARARAARRTCRPPSPQRRPRRAAAAGGWGAAEGAEGAGEGAGEGPSSPEPAAWGQAPAAGESRAQEHAVGSCMLCELEDARWEAWLYLLLRGPCRPPGQPS